MTRTRQHRVDRSGSEQRSTELKPDENEEQDYAVGYRRPPKSTRFKSGQSGNPAGRKKESGNLKTILSKVLGEDMRIREGDHVRRMSK